MQVPCFAHCDCINCTDGEMQKFCLNTSFGTILAARHQRGCGPLADCGQSPCNTQSNFLPALRPEFPDALMRALLVPDPPH